MCSCTALCRNRLLADRVVAPGRGRAPTGSESAGAERVGSVLFLFSVFTPLRPYYLFFFFSWLVGYAFLGERGTPEKAFADATRRALPEVSPLSTADSLAYA